MRDTDLQCWIWRGLLNCHQVGQSSLVIRADMKSNLISHVILIPNEGKADIQYGFLRIRFATPLK